MMDHRLLQASLHCVSEGQDWFRLPLRALSFARKLCCGGPSTGSLDMRCFASSGKSVFGTVLPTKCRDKNVCDSLSDGILDWHRCA